MDDNTITITYEALFDILRREKTQEELQKLEKDFFASLLSYLREKRSITEKKDQDNLFSEDNTVSAQRQLDNIKKLAREIYERREKKILNIAINKSRTGSNLIDTSSLLDEETKLYDELVGVLNKFRTGILMQILNEQEIKIKEPEKTIETNEPQKEQKPTKLVRFLAPVPRFVGKNLEPYGPFEEENVANLPNEIADLLINKGKVEAMQQKHL